MEINQAGLSWETILKKETSFRKAYSNFNVKNLQHTQKFLYQFRNNTVVSPFAGHDLAVTLNASTGAVALRGEGNVAAIKSANFFNTNGILYTVNQFLLP